MILLRLTLQTVVLALAQIWVNKVRALLTTLGIIIAVWAVVVTVAVMAGLKQFVLDQFESMGANKVWVFPNWPRQSRERFSYRQIRITQEQVDGMLAAVPSLQRLTPIMQMSPAVQYGDIVRKGVSVSGVRPEWHEIEQRFVTHGRTFTRIDEDERRQVCLINDKGVEEFGLEADPSGTTILVDGRRFLIVGVVETKQPNPMMGDQDGQQTEIIIPFATGVMMRPEPRLFVIAQTWTPEQFEDAKAEVTGYMRRVRHLQPEDPNTFGVEAIEAARAQFGKVAFYMTTAVGGLAAISLLVGGIGIMNIMLVSVSERTREIGLRKAVGARPEVVLVQFLVEAVTLCMIGGAIGLIASQGAVIGIRAMGMKGAAIPLWAIAVGVGFSALTGVVFGMGPAIKASRLDPIEALRHE
jgi:putative ABC transport system permease protein